MADSSQAPLPGTRGICSDCGAAFDTASRRGPLAICCDACQAKRLASMDTVTSAEMPKKIAGPWYRSMKLWLWLLVIISLVFAGFHWEPALLHQYHRWSQNMHARRAADAFERKDYEHAILDGRRALDFDPLDIESNRIIAKSREAQGSTEAIPWRARLNLIRPGDPENAIAWARDALNAGSIETAEAALEVLKPADRNIADYHDISARIAMAGTDPVQAESHWKEAVRLDPASEDYRLRLATLQVHSHSDAIRESAKNTLLSLIEIPRHRLTALRALIEDAINHRESSRARKLADQLISSPNARFNERLGRLTVLRTLDAPDAPEYLEQLRDESLHDPEQLSVLFRWMNHNDLPLLVSDWVPGLPDALISQPPVCLAVADAYGRDRDWPKLRAFVETAVWKDFEHVRLAHLSHALDNFGNVVAAEATWGRALAECRDRPERLAALVQLAQSWRWDAQAELTLRKLSTDDRTPLWVLDGLWEIARKSGDSEELHRLSRLIVKARPKNVAARNNFIRLSLLRRKDEGATHRLAAEFFEESPTEISRAVTHALSLFFQGRVLEAKEILRAFPDAELREPQAALYYSIFLQASGDFPMSAEFLEIARRTKLLHDEEELVARVKRESRFNTLSPLLKTPPQPPPQPPKKAE